MKKIYKPAEFVEVGKIYYIPCEVSHIQYCKIIVIKILQDCVIAKLNGEEFGVSYSDLYVLEQTDY